MPFRRLGWLATSLLGGMLLGGMLLAQADGAATYHIHGMVVDRLTGKPVPRALVISADQKIGGLTDSEGRFEFAVTVRMPARGGDGGFSGGGLTPVESGPGTLYLLARKQGYLQATQPAVVALKAGTDGAEVRLKLMPEAIVTGRVSATGVEQAKGVAIMLLHRQVQDGEARWMTMQGRQTNSRGEYRFAELAPGEYKVMTQEWIGDGPNLPARGGRTVGYPPVFYPDAREAAEAALLRVGAGAVVQADLVLQAQSYWPVTIPMAKLPAESGVSVNVGGEEGISGYALGYDPQRQTVTGALPDGRYRVSVITFSQNRGTGVPPAQMTGETQITVAGQATVGAPIALASSGSIPIEVREQFTARNQGGSGLMTPVQSGLAQGGRDETPLQMVYVTLRPEDGRQNMAQMRQPTAKDKRPLAIDNVRAGRYRVEVTPTYRGYVAEVRSGGVDLLRAPLEVGAGGASAPIEVTMRDDGATIHGTVKGLSAGAGGFGTSLMAIPEGGARVTQAGVGPDGKFEMGNLAPGKYRLLAFRGPMPELEYRSEEAMRRYDSKGATVTLAAGQEANVEVPLAGGEEESWGTEDMEVNL